MYIESCLKSFILAHLYYERYINWGAHDLVMKFTNRGYIIAAVAEDGALRETRLESTV